MRIVVSAKMETVRFSLRTSVPGEVKIRQAAAAAYLETVWLALRANAPLSLTHRQATALAGILYRAWANGAGRERTSAVEAGIAPRVLDAIQGQKPRTVAETYGDVTLKTIAAAGGEAAEVPHPSAQVKGRSRSLLHSPLV